MRAGPEPTQLLKASSDGAVTAETGRVFQRRIVEGKKELLLAFTEQYGTMNRISWPLVDVPECIRSIILSSNVDEVVDDTVHHGRLTLLTA